MVFVFLWLISLSIMLSRPIHVLANGRIFSFLWLNTIPLCVCVYHIFFIYSSIDGYLGCLHVLTIVSKATVKMGLQGLPWWRSGWESACQCRGHGFEPWSGKIPHAAEQLSPWATITEPVRLEPVLHNKRGRNNEKPAHRDEEWPPLAATRESPRTETKTQHSHK